MVHQAALNLEVPVMNGAGSCKLLSDVEELARCPIGAIVVGSITSSPRKGNQIATYYSEAHFSVNSKGLPNRGIEYYKKILPTWLEIAHNSKKKLIVSIAGFSPKDYGNLVSELSFLAVDGIEVNCGCPNVWGKEGIQKPIASFNEKLMAEILESIERNRKNNTWISIKLSPYSDPYQLASMAKNVLNKSSTISAIVSSNTFPNAFYFDKYKTPVIDSGYGGLAGSAILPIGLGQVRQLREVLRSDIGIIGVGGISKKEHMEAYLYAGARAVQVTTAYLNNGSSVFRQLGRTRSKESQESTSIVR